MNKRSLGWFAIGMICTLCVVYFQELADVLEFCLAVVEISFATLVHWLKESL